MLCLQKLYNNSYGAMVITMVLESYHRLHNIHFVLHASIILLHKSSLKNIYRLEMFWYNNRVGS